jgi:hypothetical protein
VRVFAVYSWHSRLLTNAVDEQDQKMVSGYTMIRAAEVMADAWMTGISG